jgi:hypothetical protein
LGEAGGATRRAWVGDVYIHGMDKPDSESVEIVSIGKIKIWTLKNILSKLFFSRPFSSALTSVGPTGPLKDKGFKSV